MKRDALACLILAISAAAARAQQPDPEGLDCLAPPRILPGVRPSACDGVSWCVCVRTELSDRQGGEPVAIRQRQLYPALEPLFGFQVLSVDGGTLDLEPLRALDRLGERERELGRVRVVFPLAADTQFLLSFALRVTDVFLDRPGGARADFEFRLTEASPDAVAILGYDPADRFHSHGLLYRGSVVSFGEGEGFELLYALPDDPPDGTFLAIERDELLFHGLNLPVEVELFAETSPVPFTLPGSGGTLTATAIIEEILDPVGLEFVNTFEIAAMEDADFRRGDADGDGKVDLTDAVFLLDLLFREGEVPGCADAADADDGGSLNISDALAILIWLFRGGSRPPPPGPDTCGPDSTDDALPCRAYDCQLLL